MNIRGDTKLRIVKVYLNIFTGKAMISISQESFVTTCSYSVAKLLRVGILRTEQTLFIYKMIVGEYGGIALVVI